MIDMFIRTNTTEPDIKKVLNSLSCHRVQVRDGGPTQIWHKTPAGWILDKPGMILYEDLSPDYISFAGYLSEDCGSLPVEEVTELTLDFSDAIRWLSHMEMYRYSLEDAIGCTVEIEHEEDFMRCASALFPLSEFKSFYTKNTAFNQVILSWVTDALSAGADQVDVLISLAAKPEKANRVSVTSDDISSTNKNIWMSLYE